jgi:uncharacterized protein YjbI with pentapeptide repeats
MTTHTEDFTIPKRWSLQTGVTVSIACDPAAPFGVKLGLAVRAAYASGADLRGVDLSDAVLSGAVLSGVVLRGADLRGADLRRADLRGADLRGAVLRGADLSGAVLRGAVLRGEEITRILASVDRTDGYTFYAFELEAGGVKISAGCRWFTVAEFRAHILAEYPDTAKATETGDILDFIEARCRALDVALEPVK